MEKFETSIKKLQVPIQIKKKFSKVSFYLNYIIKLKRRIHYCHNCQKISVMEWKI